MDGSDGTNYKQARRILDNVLGEPSSFTAHDNITKIARLFDCPEEFSEENAKEISLPYRRWQQVAQSLREKVPQHINPFTF
ncbi:hypothetical protein DL546_001656 [Coniochaeta pulveracea]|uniref:Uncharacterized protein n=1 Tax=Coniochaeta pulveracea TaxID=177199 RepID=A0A420Y451_9PEZI|nr:hypothetical protein DL546_001656 [Coniochaeta pulveracea]